MLRAGPWTARCILSLQVILWSTSLLLLNFWFASCALECMSLHHGPAYNISDSSSLRSVVQASPRLFTGSTRSRQFL